MVCGNCAREIHGDRTGCLYCGWTKTDGLAAPTAMRAVAGSEDPRTYRAGATTWRFLIWASAAAVAAFLLLTRDRVPAALGDPKLRFGVALALLVLGPLAFGAQLLRTFLVKVTIDPSSGLVLRSGAVVPWSEIENVQYAGFRLLSGAGVFVFLLDIVRSSISQSRVFGLWGALLMLVRIAFMAVIGGLMAGFAVVSGVILPVMLLLSPLEPRILVHLKRGSPLVWRDLQHEADFVHGVERGLRRSGNQEP
jgi:hypothetical protein